MVFRTRYSYFDYQLISFSLFNTLVSFQGYINKILLRKLDELIIAYLDNILIYINKTNYINSIK